MKSLLLGAALVLLAGREVGGQVVDLRCTAEVCDEWLAKNECPTLEEECVESGRVFTFPVECGCCDYCVKYLEEDAWCDIGQPGQPTPGAICGAGLGCTKVQDYEHAICRPLQTTCHAQQTQHDEDEAEGLLGHLRQRPACDEYGNFAAATCIPGSICYCVNPNGNRIFGERAFDSPDLQRTMTCACSRDAWRASRLKLGADATFAHCLADGSYDPLQCVDSQCTCVDEEGIPDVVRVHVALLNVSSPECFDTKLSHTVGRWSRECEAERADQLAVQRHVARENATFVSDLPSCGLDGKYERKQHRGEKVMCTDPDGHRLENFETSRYTPEGITMNCNCARTRHTLWVAAEGTGLSPVLPDCCPNGNFKAWQCSRGLCYCVDPNGNQRFNEVSERDKEQLDCYMEDGDGEENPCAVVTPV